jgi:AraC-like DNA-binding protein
MKYQTFMPSETLKPFVRYFWALESRSVDNVPKTFGAIVDGCPGVVMVQSEKEAFCDEQNKKLSEIFLYGQTIKPVQFTSAGKFLAIGICFQPHALKSIFGFDAGELTNGCVDLNLVSHKKHDNISERLLSAPSLGDQIGTLSHYLTDRIKSNNRQVDETTKYALAQIVQAGGNISLKTLQQKLQLSERSLERKFNQAIGISPKLFSRICRFQESLNQMRKSNYDKISDIAYEHNYADQSHFIRVFREFTGFSPLDFKKQSSEVVGNFPQIMK